MAVRRLSRGLRRRRGLAPRAPNAPACRRPSPRRRAAAGQLQAAAERQRAELSRTSAYAHSIGCDNQKFLFFGSEPPPQCGEIKGQIARMQANLADLQARSGGGRGDLDRPLQRRMRQCAEAADQHLRGAVRRRREATEFNPDELPPPDEQQQMIEKSIENEKKGANVSAGSYAVCVRTCDGSFFPVSYSGAGSRADSLEEVCRSLCPNADVRSIRSRSAARSTRRCRRPASAMSTCPTRSSSSSRSIRPARAAARARAGRRRSPRRRPNTATSRTTFW